MDLVAISDHRPMMIEQSWSEWFFILSFFRGIYYFFRFESNFCGKQYENLYKFTHHIVFDIDLNISILFERNRPKITRQVKIAWVDYYYYY